MPLVVAIEGWAHAQPLESERLELEPLRAEHADEMAPLLDDPRLHAFIGGNPPTAAELRSRYERQAAGRSPDGSQRWLNWIVRRREDTQAVGAVQATVSEREGRLTAEVAWVTGTPQQRRGYAREAAQVMVAWLERQGVEAVIAHVHPRHQASMAIAAAVGLTPTDTVVDGEVRWRK